MSIFDFLKIVWKKGILSILQKLFIEKFVCIIGVLFFIENWVDCIRKFREKHLWKGFRTILSSKYMMTSNDNLVRKGSKEFYCDICDYISCRQSQYDRHKLTAKHKKMTERFNIGSNGSDYICSCGKIFKYRQGLHKHKSKCSPDSNKEAAENPVIDTNLFMKILQQNENLQNLLIQQSNEHMQKQTELMNKLIEREPGNNNNTINGNVTNNNNNKFNLNFFLNETCKDAMNIKEFMENIRINFQDLLKIGNEGFVNGVSDIFIKQLQDLDVSKRPIHCTDSKRETIYFKEEDVWNKDDKDKTRLKQLIERVEYRNVVALRDWCNETPDAKVNNTPNNLLKDKIYLQTLQGDERTRDKIIKNMVKQIMVDKE